MVNILVVGGGHAAQVLAQNCKSHNFTHLPPTASNLAKDNNNADVVFVFDGAQQCETNTVQHLLAEGVCVFGFTDKVGGVLGRRVGVRAVLDEAALTQKANPRFAVLDAASAGTQQDLESILYNKTAKQGFHGDFVLKTDARFSTHANAGSNTIVCHPSHTAPQVCMSSTHLLRSSNAIAHITKHDQQLLVEERLEGVEFVIFGVCTGNNDKRVAFIGDESDGATLMFNDDNVDCRSCANGGVGALKPKNLRDFGVSDAHVKQARNVLCAFAEKMAQNSGSAEIGILRGQFITQPQETIKAISISPCLSLCDVAVLSPHQSLELVNLMVHSAQTRNNNTALPTAPQPTPKQEQEHTICKLLLFHPNYTIAPPPLPTETTTDPSTTVSAFQRPAFETRAQVITAIREWVRTVSDSHANNSVTFALGGESGEGGEWESGRVYNDACCAVTCSASDISEATKIVDSVLKSISAACPAGSVWWREEIGNEAFCSNLHQHAQYCAKFLPPTPEKCLRIGVLASTNCTDMDAIVAAINGNRLAATIVLVVSNKRTAGVVEKCLSSAIPVVVVPSKNRTREEFDGHVTTLFQQAGVDVVLAIGFMRILSPSFCKAWENRVFNVHPSLLPAFGGGMDSDVHKQVIAAGVERTGCTVHAIEEGVDTGAIARQEWCFVLFADNADSIRERVQCLEGLALINTLRSFTLNLKHV